MTPKGYILNLQENIQEKIVKIQKQNKTIN